MARRARSTRAEPGFASLRAASSCPPLAQEAFTLVEVITALAILGILAAIAAPRFLRASEFRARVL
jgi:prepilin-type N-terminal cleavage/methylation domain-containing protein